MTALLMTILWTIVEWLCIIFAAIMVSPLVVIIDFWIIKFLGANPHDDS